MAKKEQRTSKAEMERRIHQIVRAINEGNSRYTIARTIMKDYGVKEAFAYKMHAKAIEKIKQSYADETKFLSELMLADLNYIYKLAVQQQNLPAALKAKKQIAELTGIEAPKKTDSSIKLDGFENIDDKQLAAIIASGNAIAGESRDGISKP